MATSSKNKERLPRFVHNLFNLTLFLNSTDSKNNNNISSLNSLSKIKTVNNFNQSQSQIFFPINLKNEYPYNNFWELYHKNYKDLILKRSASFGDKKSYSQPAQSRKVLNTSGSFEGKIAYINNTKINPNVSDLKIIHFNNIMVRHDKK